MDNKSDITLLRAYTVRRDEAAFSELVRRHTDFVYSAALRQVESDATARDLTQGVFTDLARRAGDILAVGRWKSCANFLPNVTRFWAVSSA